MGVKIKKAILFLSVGVLAICLFSIPSDIEKDLSYWIDTVKYYCPWSGRIAKIG